MFFILIFFIIYFLNNLNAIILTDFDSMMLIPEKRILNSKKSIELLGISSSELLNKIKQHYNSTNIKTKKNGIPKIIHQIWLGSPFPEKFKHWQKLIKVFHPDWQYKLWTDNDVRTIRLINQDLYDKSNNYGQKSDILRYEILYKYGGLYLDVDIECLKSFDLLSEKFDFFAGLEPLWPSTITCLSVGNAIIASCANHPIIENCILQLRNSHQLKINDLKLEVVIKSGPIFFTKCCFSNIGKSDYLDIILPSMYLYPSEPNALVAPKKNHPNTVCIHHWSHSWIK